MSGIPLKKPAPYQVLAECLGCSEEAVRRAATEGVRTHGHLLARVRATDELRERWGVDGRTRYMAKLLDGPQGVEGDDWHWDYVKAPVEPDERRDEEDLRAELAAADAEIEKLREELEEAREWAAAARVREEVHPEHSVPCPFQLERSLELHHRIERAAAELMRIHDVCKMPDEIEHILAGLLGER